MATNRNVTVLAPNGRRQNVKVTLDTTILQIIEEVCKKQGYDAKDFDIKHHRKVLDVSVTIRYSGIPNNAQLELVPIEKPRLEGVVTIGLQLEDGQRLVGDFQPNAAMMDILEKLCPEHASPGLNPVVIYTQREIYGEEALRNTTLKHLGLTKGRAILRLIHRSPEELKTQANVSAPLPNIPKNVEEPYIRKKKVSDTSPPRDKSVEKETPAQSKEEESVRQQPPPLPRPDNKKPVDLINLIKQEKESKRKPNTSPQRKSTDPSVPTSKEKGESTKTGNGTSKKRELSSPEPSASSNLSDKYDEEFVFLGDRNAIAFSQEMAKTVRTEDLPDDFFELTINDAKRLIRDIKRTRMELENQHLETKAMRSLRETQRQLTALNKYKKAIIRVVFPDHTVLQGTFNPTETVSHVVEFVRDFLEDKSTHFYLYTAPPKEILSKESRLIETGCVPSAIVYFGTDQPKQDGKYLKNEVLNKLVSPSKASTATEKMRKESMRNLPQEATTVDESTSSDDLTSLTGPSTSSGVKNYENYEPRNPKPNPPNAPKWFKLSK